MSEAIDIPSSETSTMMSSEKVAMQVMEIMRRLLGAMMIVQAVESADRLLN